MKIKRNESEDDLVQALATAKAYQADAAEQVKLAQDRLTEYMVKHQRKSLTSTDGGKKYRVTYVTNTTVSIDEKGLKKALGAKAFNKLTVAKLDRKKLEDAMETGEVDPFVVGAHVTEKTSAPYIRFSEGVAKDAEDVTE